jgi:hypothetical protein
MDDQYKMLMMLIESVSKQDTATLDDIDVRTLCFLNKRQFDEYTHNGLIMWSDGDVTGSLNKKVVMPYSRSLEAAYSINDGGNWQYDLLIPWNGGLARCEAARLVGAGTLKNKPLLPTPELALLHAKIQVVAWERENNE